MAQTNIEEIHVLSLDGGGSRGIMESIMLGHIMDISTLLTKKPSKITEIIRSFQLDAPEDYPEVGKKFQSLIELEKLSPIHPTEAFQYIVGKKIFSTVKIDILSDTHLKYFQKKFWQIHEIGFENNHEIARTTNYEITKWEASL